MRLTRNAARQAVLSQYYFVANDEEAFSVFGRSEVQDINRIRQCTDIMFLALFLAVLSMMVMLDIEAASLGNVLRLSEPIDFQGQLCGFDPEVEDKPLGYYPNPCNDMVVCVSACPKTAADGRFTLPDGPMGKFHTRDAYPTAQIYGQHCLPLDLTLAKQIISTKSVQSELYRALGSIFNASDIMFAILFVPLMLSVIFLVMLLFIPPAASLLAFSSTTVTLIAVAMILQLDEEVLASVPLYKETHPLMLKMMPVFRNGCYFGAVVFLGMLAVAVRSMAHTRLVFRECMQAVTTRNTLVVVFTSMFISTLRIAFMIHICKSLSLLMSIINPVDVRLQLFGEWHYVGRMAWAPHYMHAIFFYSFGSFWTLEFMSYCNKYITAQIICHNYFLLSGAAAAQAESRAGAKWPLRYAITSLFRNHLGSVAYGALLSAPCNSIRFFIGFFVPDRPNLHKSTNQQHKMAAFLFYHLIAIDLHFLRFFKDSVWVLLPLKGENYMASARRAEGLLNRCRGQIPNLTKFTGKIYTFLNISIGLSAMFWTFLLYREPRHGQYHEVEDLHAKDAARGLFAVPEHSPLLSLPVMFAFGLWVGNGTLHLVQMASNALTICYCIDVEMVGGAETDALYAKETLKDAFKDLGGGESERERSEMMMQAEQGTTGD